MRKSIPAIIFGGVIVAAVVLAFAIGTNTIPLPPPIATLVDNSFLISSLRRKTPTPTPVSMAAKVTVTPTFLPIITATFTVTPTETPTATAIPTETPTATNTVVPVATATTVMIPTATSIVGNIQPYPSAPLCVDSGENHDNTAFHTSWDNVRGCHYDHEHGMNPFTQEVADKFPGFNLYQLIGNVGVGHTNLSSPLENTLKHGGFKWDVTFQHTAGCETGPAGEGNVAGTGVDAFVSQYHNFGNYAIEAESRVHTALILMRQCRFANPTDYGYVFVIQFQDYGQRVVPYQGIVYPYPNNPPPYDPTLSPYLSIGCVNGGVIQCRESLQFILDRNADATSTWVSRPQAVPIGSTLFSILFRLRDNYQVIDWNDQIHPFTFYWLCSLDGGTEYTPRPGCRYNNSTSRIHELHGIIPQAWDNLNGFDSNPAVGRITAEGFVSAYGNLMSEGLCQLPNTECFPIKMVNAFVGPYLSTFGLVSGKGQFTIDNLPERDVYFCGNVVCNETSPGAVSSGWIGPNN